MAQGLITCYASPRCTVIQNEAQKFDPELLNAYFLGLVGDAVAKDDIYKFQEGKNYILLTNAHLMLLPNHLFSSSLIFLSKAFKIHSFLSVSINIIPSNSVLRGLQQNFAHDSHLQSACHPWRIHMRSDCKLFFRIFRSGIKQLNATHPLKGGGSMSSKGSFLASYFFMFPGSQLISSLPWPLIWPRKSPFFTCRTST